MRSALDGRLIFQLPAGIWVVGSRELSGQCALTARAGALLLDGVACAQISVGVAAGRIPAGHHEAILADPAWSWAGFCQIGRAGTVLAVCFDGTGSAIVIDTHWRAGGQSQTEGRRLRAHWRGQDHDGRGYDLDHLVSFAQGTRRRADAESGRQIGRYGADDTPPGL